MDIQTFSYFLDTLRTSTCSHVFNLVIKINMNSFLRNEDLFWTIYKRDYSILIFINSIYK